MELDEIIEFENESTYIDFKAVEYDKEKHEDFLKDIISMANSDFVGAKYIIVGIKLKGDGSRSYLGLDRLTDSATYQQLVSDKIEPELTIDYSSYDFKGVRLGIFTILNCDNKPYIIKNQYKKLTSGDSFIRVGTHQRKLNRSDLDKIYVSKYSTDFFYGEVSLIFSASQTDCLELKGHRKLEFPSDIVREGILNAIKDKEDGNQLKQLITPPITPFGNTLYERRSLEELKDNLENVTKTYSEDDHYYYYEEMAELLNFTILNNSDKYLEDCSIEFIFDESAFLKISDRIYEQPKGNSPFQHHLSPSYSQINYPNVEMSAKKYIVQQHIGDLRHKIPTEVFEEPLRIVPIGGLNKNNVNVRVKIFGKNLKEPLERLLEIIII